MISIPSISQTTLSSLTAVSPLSIQRVSTSASAGSISAALLDSMSSIVQLSATGQVLSADSLLKNSLQSLQTSSSAATASSVITATQNFVAAFNQTQLSISNALPLLGSQSGSTLIKQLSQTLNAAATAPASSSGAADLANLQSIGITAQSSLAPGTAQTTVTLSVDQAALTAAASANPAATQTLLTQATQPLLQQVASFEAVATSTAGLANGSTTQSVGIPTNLLQSLSADTLANAVQLGDIDLAAVGLDTNTLQLAGSVLNGSLSATLTAAINASATSTIATSTPGQTGATTATQATPSATTTTLAVAAPTAAAVTPSTTPAPATPALTTTPATSVATTATTPTTVDQTNPADTLAQQSQLNDEAQRILNNNAFNPYYSAVIANYHINDDVIPGQAGQPLSEPVIPAPVLAVRRMRAINA